MNRKSEPVSAPICLECERVKRGDVRLDALVPLPDGARACASCAFVYYAECFALEAEPADEVECAR